MKKEIFTLLILVVLTQSVFSQCIEITLEKNGFFDFETESTDNDEFIDETPIFDIYINRKGPDLMLTKGGQNNCDTCLQEKGQFQLDDVNEPDEDWTDLVVAKPNYTYIVKTNDENYAKFFITEISGTEYIKFTYFVSDSNDLTGICVEEINPTDLDEDGFGSSIDCNDLNAEIFPGAEEKCNGVDDNCNEEIDEGCPLDSDGDTVIDKEDNCPDIANPDQADSDEDGLGDACDPTPNPAPTETPTPTPTSPPCEPGWKCRDEFFRGYQKSDCSWTEENLRYCTMGCENGDCLEDLIPTQTPTTTPTQTPTPTETPTPTPTAQPTITPTPNLDCGDLKNNSCYNTKSSAYCLDGNLIADCLKCGCPDNETCDNQTGKCNPAYFISVPSPQEPRDYVPYIIVGFGVVILILLANQYRVFFRDQNLREEKRRFELAKNKRAMKELRVSFYKRKIGEKDYREKALMLQAEIMELEKIGRKPGKRKKTHKKKFEVEETENEKMIREINKRTKEIKMKREKGSKL